MFFYISCFGNTDTAQVKVKSRMSHNVLGSQSRNSVRRPTGISTFKGSAGGLGPERWGQGTSLKSL